MAFRFAENSVRKHKSLSLFKYILCVLTTVYSYLFELWQICTWVISDCHQTSRAKALYQKAMINSGKESICHKFYTSFSNLTVQINYYKYSRAQGILFTGGCPGEHNLRQWRKYWWESRMLGVITRKRDRVSWGQSQIVRMAETPFVMIS